MDGYSTYLTWYVCSVMGDIFYLRGALINQDLRQKKIWNYYIQTQIKFRPKFMTVYIFIFTKLIIPNMTSPAKDNIAYTTNLQKPLTCGYLMLNIFFLPGPKMQNKKKEIKNRFGKTHAFFCGCFPVLLLYRHNAHKHKRWTNILF